VEGLDAAGYSHLPHHRRQQGIVIIFSLAYTFMVLLKKTIVVDISFVVKPGKQFEL